MYTSLYRHVAIVEFIQLAEKVSTTACLKDYSTVLLDKHGTGDSLVAGHL